MHTADHLGLTPAAGMVFPILPYPPMLRHAEAIAVRPIILVLITLFTGTAAAQPGTYLAEVTAESTTVRAGPSDQLPDTGTLFRGAKLMVAYEEGEHWVAVQAPRGQMSWIRSVHLGPLDGQATDSLPRNAIVHAEPDADIAFGRPGLGKPLEVRRTKIPDRTIVLVIGKKVEHDGVGWYPIEPPDGDLRYVPKSAIRLLSGQPGQAFVVRSPQPEPATRAGIEPVAASIPNRLSPGARPAGWPNNPLWQQAEQAEQGLDYTKAESLYLKLAAEMNQAGGDSELANLCYTRVHAVREKQRQGSRGATTPTPKRAEPSGQWVGPGVVRPAGFRWENKTTFALVGPQGQLKCYAVAGPGVDLERFRGSEVDLFGTSESPGELRGVGIVTVSRVQNAKEK